MSAVLKFRPSSLPLPTAPMPVDPLRLLPDYARMEAERCLAVIRPALIRVQQGCSVRAAATWLHTSAEGMPSRVTLQRWIKQYLTGGIVALAPKGRGKQRKEYGWEAEAQRLFNSGQQRAFSTVAIMLTRAGFTGASEHNVRRYLKSLPANLVETGKKRVGVHYHAQNIKPYVIRDSSVLPVGFIYQGDGHCCDVYVQHPAKGHFRPELTVWIDVRSNYVVSWWISESESAQTTLFSLSQALYQYDHVPAMVHTDPGSGFKAKMITDEVTGFLVRFGIDPMLALPGNAKGKGLIEGWFRWFEERCGKQFATFCGHCRTDDDLNRLKAKIERGMIELPSLQQYIDAIKAYIAEYNARPQAGLGNKAPADLWADLERTPLHTPAEALIRPRKVCVVQRRRVRLDNRRYEAPQLSQYDTREVQVEYSIHDDDRVAILDMTGRWVCEALLVGKKAWMPASRIAEAQQKRLAAQIKRKQDAIDLDRARAHMPMVIAANTQAAIGLDAGHSISIPAPAPAAAIRPPLDARATEILGGLQQQPLQRMTVPRVTRSENDIQQRFERAQRLQAELAAGGQLQPADAEWLQRYQNTPEFRSQLRFHQSFGTPA